MHKHLNKRIVWSLLILSALIGVLVIRLAWVQLVLKHRAVPGAAYTMAQMAAIQSERETVLDSGRGRLYDRNGRPLAGETVWTAAFFPQEETAAAGDSSKLKQLAAVLGVSYGELESRISGLKEPLLWPSAGAEAP